MANAKILVVDDDQEFVELITLHLDKRGYRVLSASDGRQALELARRCQPDLTILDVLPTLDGLEVCQILRAESRVPIIVSSRSTDADKLAGLNMGADDYVTKPFCMNELLARIRAVLRRTLGMETTWGMCASSAVALNVGGERRRPVLARAVPFLAAAGADAICASADKFRKNDSGV